MTDYWFKPKSYGYGATPINWKGWVSTLAMVVALLAVFRFFISPIPGSHSPWDVGLGLALALAVVVLFSLFAKAKTSGEWRWRWGKNSNGSL